MGFFDDKSTGTALGALSKDRIKAVLDARESSYGVDEDGDIGGVWDGHLFYFFVIGNDSEILQLRGRWSREVGADQFDALLRLANQTNAERLFPKVYVLLEGEGVSVYTEHTVDYEHGVSDEQLDLHLASAIGSSIRFFETLDEAYPEAAAVAKAAQEKLENS